jgi:ribulose-5-phosphate 4-epimerase/fuculose-1-phosphate aldolase
MPDLRHDICCAARILYRAGLSAGNAGHISISLGDGRMLVNRFGPSFATLSVPDILTVGFDGRVIEHAPGVSPYVNDTIALHGTIHREVPQATAVVHTHPPATTTWSTLRKLPEYFDQESCILADEIAIVEEEYEGLASKEERLLPLTRKLADHRIALLPNHGAVTTGPSVQAATIFMLLLEGMAARNLAVATLRAAALNPQPIRPEFALTAKREIARIPFVEPLWQDLNTRLHQTDPDLFAHRIQGVA